MITPEEIVPSKSFLKILEQPSLPNNTITPPPRRCYGVRELQKLIIEEREEMSLHLAMGSSFRLIACSLGKSPYLSGFV